MNEIVVYGYLNLNGFTVNNTKLKKFINMNYIAFTYDIRT